MNRRVARTKILEFERGSSPFSSSQDLSAIIEKSVMPKVKDITENITKNLQRPPEGWDVFKAVSSKPKSGGSIPMAASPPRTTFKHARITIAENKFFSIELAKEFAGFVTVAFR